MPTPPRILFVAEPSAAVEVLTAVREAGPVHAQLAPTAEVLRATLADPDATRTWDAVVFVPGGPVEEVEVAAFVPEALALFVVGSEIPLLMSETAAVAIPPEALATLLAHLRETPPAAEAPAAEETLAFEPFEPVTFGREPAPQGNSETPRPSDESVPVEPLGDEPSTPDPSETWGPEAELDALPASIADHLPIGLYRTSPDGRILYANPALAAALHVESVDALASLDVQRDLSYPRDAFIEEVARTGAVRNLVVEWVGPSGERIFTRENTRSLLNADGKLVGYEGTMEDVTAEIERQREEQAVARQHRAIAAFAAAAALAEDRATIQCAAVGALLDAAEAEWACLVIDGQGPVATAGQPPSGLDAAGSAFSSLLAAPSVVPNGARGTSELAHHLAAHGVGAYASVPVRGRGEALGVLLWGYASPLEITSTDVRGAESLAWHVGSHLDRASAQRALRDTQASLETIAEYTPHVLYRLRYTPGGPVYEYLSPAMETLTGLPRAEIEARGGPQALIETREVLEGDGLAAGPVEGAEAYRALYRMATVAGPRWVENSARVWRSPSGAPVGLIGVLQDVSERKEREDRLATTAHDALVRQRALVDLAHLDGADAFGGPAAAIVAATLRASDVSFWLCDTGRPCGPLHAPSPANPAATFDGAFAAVLDHVSQHRALAVADVATDRRIDALGLGSFVQTYGLRALLVAPIRRRGRVAGLVAVHRTDGPHDWDGAEAEFAAAVADAVALALEREDREQAVADLVEAREAAEAGQASAERMNRIKSAFLANMSHEVRTPLTGILGFAGLLADEVAPDQRDFVQMIERNGRRLLDTLNAVLDLSQLEAGEYDADRRPVELGPEIVRAAEPFRQAALDKGLRFDVDVDAGVAARVDVAVLDQILRHVVGNAVKFTGAGGVLVTLEATADEAVLRVADTGLGISEAFLPEALDAFRQEVMGDDRSHEGSGLGLTIAHRLVALLDGTIAIASERPGGTVVTVTLPRVASPAAPPAVAALSTGDGLDAAVTLRPPLTTGTAADPANLLGQPFDFTFLDAPTVDPVLPSTPETPPPAPTDMFDFRFGRSPAPDPAPEPAPTPRPASATPPPSPPSPPRPPASIAPDPIVPDPVAPAAPVVQAPRPAAEPAMIVRATPPSRPTIPEAAQPEEAELLAAADGRPSVLVVEDNDDTRMLLERILRSTYDVTAVGDARSALLAMNQRRFTALVLDINLGGKETGADVLRIARSLPNYDGVFAIALTAYALPGDRERLLESGFSAYISKPFTRQSLMETLEAGVVA